MVDDASDRVARTSRAVARGLVPELGSGVETSVEAALAAGRDGGGRQYDLVSVGGLIVSIAALAWTIYDSYRKRTPESAPEVLERVLRSEIRREVEVTPDSVRITEVVVNVIIGTQNFRH